MSISTGTTFDTWATVELLPPMIVDSPWEEMSKAWIVLGIFVPSKDKQSKVSFRNIFVPSKDEQSKDHFRISVGLGFRVPKDVVGNSTVIQLNK